MISRFLNDFKISARFLDDFKISDLFLDFSRGGSRHDQLYSFIITAQFYSFTAIPPLRGYIRSEPIRAN